MTGSPGEESANDEAADTDPTEATTHAPAPARERARQLAAELPDGTIPTDDDGVVFEAPWQARLFGLVVAFHEANDDYAWTDFQARLVDAVAGADVRELQEDVESVYYGRWLETLETFLIEEGVLSAGEIEGRKAEFSAGERDASEFVVGEPGH